MHRPFNDDEVNTLGIVLQYALLFIYTAALMVKADMSGTSSEEQTGFGIVLVLLVMVGPVAIVIQTLMSIHRWICTKKETPPEGAKDQDNGDAARKDHEHSKKKEGDKRFLSFARRRSRDSSLTKLSEEGNLAEEEPPVDHILREYKANTKKKDSNLSMSTVSDGKRSISLDRLPDDTQSATSDISFSSSQGLIFPAHPDRLRREERAHKKKELKLLRAQRKEEKLAKQHRLKPPAPPKPAVHGRHQTSIQVQWYVPG